MNSQKMKIPSDWRDVSEEDAKKFVAYLLQNYKNFKLECSPYSYETNTGLVVRMSGDFGKVFIERKESAKLQRGGHQAEGMVIYGTGDYGFAYDGYSINGMEMFINQDHEYWPDKFPLENPLYKSVHKLYLAVRAETVPTYEQQEEIEQQKADQIKAQNAKQDLLEQMYKDGNISKKIFDMYMVKVKQ